MKCEHCAAIEKGPAACRWFDARPQQSAMGFDPPCECDAYSEWAVRRERRFVFRLFAVPVSFLALLFALLKWA